MSYDIWLEADLGGPEPSRVGSLDWNYTYNIQPMTQLAGLHSLNDLDGMEALQAGLRICDVIDKMTADPDAYKLLNPSNGWGDYNRFLVALRDLRDALAAAPKAIVRVG